MPLSRAGLVLLFLFITATKTPLTNVFPVNTRHFRMTYKYGYTHTHDSFN